jgi:NADH dehydrogenase
VALCDAARAAGVPRFLLLSSAGTDRLPGGYLAWKKKTEDHVIGSGLEWTIFRPSFISGPGRASNKVIGAMVFWSSVWRDIDVTDLARLFVRGLERREQVKNRIIEGNDLWELLK